MVPWRKDNPYPRYTFRHFAWSVYNLIVYQFGRFAVFAWVVLVLGLSAVELRQEQLNNKLNNQVRSNQRLIQQNKNRISDIQRSRIASCIQTYLSIQQIFEPFFPPKPVRTKAQQRALNKFENLITHKKLACKKQTKPQEK